MPLCRILVVEDFAPFRRFVSFALQPRAEFHVVAEAEDGVDAVQKAKDLQPDLVLLDIGLPKLNGIAAAEQIRILAPNAKLLFISLESSAAVVREAFCVGASGYIHKLRAQVDLVPAIEAVLAGKHFVSSDLDFSDGTKPHHHEVQFYSDEMVFLESATRFVAGALKADGAALVCTTTSHGESLVQRLKADGFDVDAAIRQGTYISLDALEVLSKILVNGLPDHGRLSEVLGTVIKSSVKAMKTKHSRIALFGECSALLCAAGKSNVAIQLEKICNHLPEGPNVDILCAYPLNVFQQADDDPAFDSICAEHTAVFSS